MSHEPLERLQAFRAENAAAKSRRGVGFVALAVALAIGAALGAMAYSAFKPGTNNQGGTPATAGGLEPERQRELALYYESKQLPDAAIAAYEEYLESTQLSEEARGAVVFSVAKLAIGENDFDRALNYLYEAEFLLPESGLREEVDKSIVRCLEELGRTAALRRELQHRTDPARDAAEAEPGAVVLATFGDDAITDRDLNREIEKLPANIRSQFDVPEQRVELLKQLVAERLLREKAFRLQLDEDEEVRRQLAAMRDSLIVRKLIEDEVRAQVSITPADVERFYKAEIARFTVPAQAQFVSAHASTAEAAAANTEFDASPRTVRAGGPLPGMPPSDDAVTAIFAAEKGAVTPPVKIGEQYFVFKVIEKQPERVTPFDEVRDQVERMLRTEKEREQRVLLIEETLRAQNVALFPERLQPAVEKP